MAADCDGLILKSDVSLNMSSDFTSDTSFSEDKHSNSWNYGNDSRDDGDLSDSDRLKRGRPRADQLSSLMVKGAQRESSISCRMCRRVFPREKSLQAHMRTHTGERPYQCDYPDCTKAFCQSGQLKTHQRLHTGEKPFVCNTAGCESRFTHANRHCSEHPTAGLTREDTSTAILQLIKEDTRPDIAQWLRRQAQMRMKTPNKPESQVKPPHKSVGSKRSLSSDMDHQWMAQKRSRLEAVSESPPHTDMPTDAFLSSPPNPGAYNHHYNNSPLHVQKTIQVENTTITELQPMRPLTQETLNHLHSTNNHNHYNHENVFYGQPDVMSFPPHSSSNDNIKENTRDKLYLERQDKDQEEEDTVTVCSMAESAVVKHTIQVRKNHQLPIQRLLKPEEYDAIRSSPKRRVPLSPIQPTVVPSRIPFSPVRNVHQDNSSPVVIKSKAQVALFASPPPKGYSALDSPARSQGESSPLIGSQGGMYMTSTPNRRLSSPRKYLQYNNQSTPIRRQSPRKHFTSSSPSPNVKGTPNGKGTPNVKGTSTSPRKSHYLYMTPSPVSSYRVQSPRRSGLFASRLATHATPVKRGSPVKLFTSPPSSSHTKIRSSPRKLNQSPVVKCVVSPMKKSSSQPSGENSDLMGALALIELAGGH